MNHMNNMNDMTRSTSAAMYHPPVGNMQDAKNIDYIHNRVKL